MTLPTLGTLLSAEAGGYIALVCITNVTWLRNHHCNVGPSSCKLVVKAQYMIRVLSYKYILVIGVINHLAIQRGPLCGIYKSNLNNQVVITTHTMKYNVKSGLIYTIILMTALPSPKICQYYFPLGPKIPSQ